MASRRSHLTLIALLVAALVGVFMLGWSGSPVHKKLHEGLDLQGGLEVVLQAKPPRTHKLTPDDMSISLNVIRNRIDSLGVSEPVVTQAGPEPDRDRAARGAQHRPGRGDHRRRPRSSSCTTSRPHSCRRRSTRPRTRSRRRASTACLTSVQSGQKGQPSQYYLFNSRTKKPVAGPIDTLAGLKSDPAVKKLKPLKAKEGERHS